MQIGLIGLPMSGKTTIFNALTGANRPVGPGVAGRLEVEIAVVDVPDPRLDALHSLYSSRRKVPARITYADIGGLAKGISEGGLSGPFRNELNRMDGFLHVVRAFENPAVPHSEGSVDPRRDVDILNNEFLLADLITVEKRIERLKDEMGKGKDREANARHLALFERLQAALEEEIPLRNLELSPAERHSLRGYGFLTLKPQIILLNINDEAAEPEDLVQALVGQGPVIAIRGALEMEIAQLEPEEAKAFMEEYGIHEPASERVIRESYRLLNLQTFFTVGDDEVRAWSCPVGATAQEAAGVIHTDMQRGFIRAEIVPIETLLELGGLAEARRSEPCRPRGCKSCCPGRG